MQTDPSQNCALQMSKYSFRIQTVVRQIGFFLSLIIPPHYECYWKYIIISLSVQLSVHLYKMLENLFGKSLYRCAVTELKHSYIEVVQDAIFNHLLPMFKDYLPLNLKKKKKNC